MKAICKSKAGSGAELIDAEIPQPSSHQVLIKVKATSICGTDVHIYNWDRWAESRIKTPLIFGHEFAGEVVEVGNQVLHLKVGDHVAIETHIPCQGCYQCQTGQMHLCQNLEIVGVDRQGCFAEYAAIPEICCIKQDKSLPWSTASILEPLGNAVYTVSESEVSGKRVAIFGDGPIGIFAAALCRVYGATDIIACGMQSYRLDLIRQFQPDHVVDVRKTDAHEAIMDLSKGRGVDVVLEMSGSHQAIHDGLASVRRGGLFTAFGIPAKPTEINFADELIFKGLTLKAINGRKMYETWHEMRELISSGRLDVSSVLTHEFPLEKIDDAMKLLNAKEIKVGKIVLKP